MKTGIISNNWWGSATDPMHPSNPAGTGNPVVDGANGGAGTVDFGKRVTNAVVGPARIVSGRDACAA